MMSTTTVLLVTTLALVWIGVLWSRRRFYKVFMQLPGPLGLPFVGLGFQMMKPEKFLQYMENITKEYKTPFITWLGTKCFLYVNDPETIENVFNSPCCTNKGDLYRFMARAIGDGLFTSSSPRWNKHRRLLNPAFGRKAIQGFLPVFNREANALVNKLKMTRGQSLEIYELLKKSVLEVACQTTMGKKMNFQNDGSAAIFESYNGITETCVKRMLSPWLYPDATYHHSALFKRQQNVSGVLYRFVENLLQYEKKHSTTADETQHHVTRNDEHCNGDGGDKATGYAGEEPDNDNANNEDGIKKSESNVFVERVRRHIQGGQLTWQDVRDEANVIVAATFETTSTALYFACLCLAMHPEYQDKLYNELAELFPSPHKDSNPIPDITNNMHPPDRTDDDAGNCQVILGDVSLEHLERMTYTEMVINEAMRLFAPVPMVLRRVSADFHLRSGTLVPEGTQIAIDIFNMHRSEQVWGPRARSFDPDTHFGASTQRHPFAFVPFTKGLRMCIGYRYALMLMKIMLAKIFRNFRVHTEAQMKDLTIKGTISLKLCDYPLCKLQPREVSSSADATT